jgi:hypothetical protein
MGNFKALSESVTSLCVDVFGDDVTYTPAQGSPVSISGVFDNAWFEVEGVNTLKPILRIDLADLDALPLKGDALSTDSDSYTVNEVHLDSHGGATLILRKV